MPLYIHMFEVLHTAPPAQRRLIGLLFLGIGRGKDGTDGITVHLSNITPVEFEPDLPLGGPFSGRKKLSTQKEGFVHGRKVEMTFELDSANEVC